MRNRLRDLMAGSSPFAMAAYEGDGGGNGGGAGDPPVDAGDKTPESILFPKEGEPNASDPAGDGKKPEGDAGKGEGGDDWKEYVPDPNKSDEENAAAKAEHDKTKSAEKGDPAADKVPEDGKYTLTMPEGVEVDQELLDAVSPRFKELGLTQKQAQALTDDFIKVQSERAKAYAEKPEGQWSMAAYDYFTKNGTPDKWADTAKADKNIGGDKWGATTSAAVRAVNHLGTPELKEFLNASGGGNHPELIRFMAKVGAMIKEDNPASGGAEGAGKPAEAAHILFPNDAPKG